MEKILLFLFGLVASGIAWHALHGDHETIANVLAGILLAVTVLVFVKGNPAPEKHRSSSRK